MTASNPFPLETLSKNRAFCAQEIGQRLASGSLALALGAGVSKCMGLPSWWQLVKACADKASVVNTVDEHTEPSQLKKMMDRVEEAIPIRAEYHDVVRECLYEVAKDDDAILDQRLLLVLGAMTMKSRRGSVSEVWNYNFDDVLERYLRLHGFTSQVVLHLPELRTDVDVTVYHPHGFLSSPLMAMEDSKEIRFSGHSFDEFVGERLNPWQEVLRDILARKFVLFIGLSPDVALNGVLVNMKQSVSKSRGATGFWFLGPGDPADSEADLLKRNIVPIRFDEYDQYYLFLLEVCQKAAEVYSKV